MKAIIDLGTNTFHLLIAEIRDHRIKEYFKLQIPVKIGEGINNGVIYDEAFERGMQALAEFKKQLNRYELLEVKAFATSAIRNARNGNLFIEEAKNRFGIRITAISGAQEAGYIYEGVRHSFEFPEQNILVMDIGGGSVEFIIGNRDRVHWKHSFELGAARLIEMFQQHDPVTDQEIEKLDHYFDEQLEPLYRASGKFPVKMLAGSAGSFETLADIVYKDLGRELRVLSDHAWEIDNNSFELFYRLIKTSTSEQRGRLNGMVDFRVEMIVVAAILMHYVIRKLEINRIICSAYSLKEGILFS